MWKKLTAINRILVPVDLTDASLCAVEAALVFAGEKKAQIYLLHVLSRREELPVREAGAAQEKDHDAWMRSRYAAMEKFFLKKIRPQSRIAYIVRSGIPHREILKFASEEGIDLIVLPVGTDIPERPAGSDGVAWQVVRNAAVPVVVVKPGQAAKKLTESPPRPQEEKIKMSYDERYLQEIRQRVCAKCIDRTVSGLCVTSTFDSCAINRYLPEIIDIVLTTTGDDLAAYVAKLRQRVCSTCEHQSTDGHCDLRDDVECALDRYFPLVIEAIQDVRYPQ